jgi:hypothetical protein
MTRLGNLFHFAQLTHHQQQQKQHSRDETFFPRSCRHFRAALLLSRKLAIRFIFPLFLKNPVTVCDGEDPLRAIIADRFEKFHSVFILVSFIISVITLLLMCFFFL